MRVAPGQREIVRRFYLPHLSGEWRRAKANFFLTHSMTPLWLFLTLHLHLPGWQRFPAPLADAGHRGARLRCDLLRLQAR